MESTTCAGCHPKQDDGTFGVPYAYDPKAFTYPEDPDSLGYSDDDEAGVALYITDIMPFGNAGGCVDECANDVAAYLWELKTAPGDKIRGQNRLTSDLCSGCHTDNGDGTAGGILPFNINNSDNLGTSTYPDTEAGLAKYITETMPSSDPNNCVGTCSADIAAYLWQFRLQL